MADEQRSENRVGVSGVSWTIRPESSRAGVAVHLENISRGGACLRLHHASPRADRLLREAVARTQLLEVQSVPRHGTKKALARWVTVGDDGLKRFGVEWVEPLEKLPAIVQDLGVTPPGH